MSGKIVQTERPRITISTEQQTNNQISAAQ